MRDIKFFVFYVFSYFIIIFTWFLADDIYSPDNYYFLIPAIISIASILFTLQVHWRHRHYNVDSSFRLAIIISILLTIICIIVCLSEFINSNPSQGTLFLLIAGMLTYNLIGCVKYRKTSSSNSTSTPTISSDSANSTTTKSSQTMSTATTSVKRAQTKVNLLSESVLYFGLSDVKLALLKSYSWELIHICAYIVRNERCVISDIQAEFGYSRQRILTELKILEKTYIVKQDGNRRSVLVSDETTAIKLLLRYAKYQP